MYSPLTIPLYIDLGCEELEVEVLKHTCSFEVRFYIQHPLLHELHHNRMPMYQEQGGRAFKLLAFVSCEVKECGLVLRNCPSEHDCFVHLIEHVHELYKLFPCSVPDHKNVINKSLP